MNYLRENKNHVILCILVIGFAALGLWIRLLPMQFILGLEQPVVLYEDPWYTIRQVEQILPHFPQISWFDPMLSFPDGKVVDWGPVFPLFASVLAILAGAGTHEEIVLAIGWAPVILGLLLIPLSFLLGKIIWDKKTGWIAAMLISVVGGETLFRSFYGDVDHHMMEVVLTTGFFVCYFYLFSKIFPLITEHPDEQNKDPNSNVYQKTYSWIPLQKIDIGLSIIAGLLYYLAIMTMPTCTIIAITVGIITFLLPLLFHEKEKIFRLLWANGIIFSLFMVLFATTGIHVSGLALQQYTIIHLLLPFFLIIESIIIYLLSSLFKNQKAFVIPGIFLVIFGIFCGICAIFLPEIFHLYTNSVNSFFGLGGTSNLIQEMGGADLITLLKSFNLTIILAIFGFILLALQLFRTRSPVLSASIIWMLVYLGISFLVARYFYYSGLIIVILAAISFSYLYDRINPVNRTTTKNNRKKSNLETITHNKTPLFIVGIIIVVITILSVNTSLGLASHDIPDFSINNEWLNSLQWLKDNSNPSAIDYYSQYSKDDFEYPINSSTVVSWWDDGHWILGVSHLSPATTPFQDKIRYVAKYLLSENNYEAEKYADYLHTKYVITTNDYIINSFPLIQQWLPQVPTKDPYIFSFYMEEPQNKKPLIPMLGFKSSFFNTTLVKLHVNDGSCTPANGSVLVEYQNTIIGSKEVPVLKSLQPLNQSQNSAVDSVLRKNQEIISLTYTSPVTDVPALQNYRLIYESEGTETFPGDVTLNNIKIFERVKGHTIPGTGTIELPLITNQGREFVYRQQSVNNSFTLPYSTTNTPYDVHATGPYRIIETNETIDVDESQIERYYK